MSGRPWHAEEVGYLRDAVARKETHASIAERLNRTESAVTAKVFHMGWSTPREFAVTPQGTFCWTEDEYRRAVNMRADGLTCKEVGLAIGRSEKAVRQKMLYFDPPIGRPTELMLLRRDRREDASYRRDLTGTLCGDPPPGYSALDRKRAAHA